jgi:pyruvate kinase
MLTKETSEGKYPLEAIKTLAKTIAETEQVYDYDQEYTNNKK